MLVVFTTIVNASNPTLKLYEKIFSSIFQTSVIDVYVDDETRDIIKDSSIFHIVDYCYDDTVVLVGNFKNEPKYCQKNLLFATNYRSFRHNNNAFGAYYWKKGRPQLIFRESVLDRFNLKLPTSLKKYERGNR